MKKFLCLILLILLSALLVACGEGESQTKQLEAMDTIMTLKAYGKNAEKGLKAAESVIRTLDDACDPDSKTSIVTAINTANGDQVAVSGQIADMLITAKKIYEETDGAYDLTIYPLVERWGFTNNQYYVPSYSEIATDLIKLCMDKVTISKFPTSGAYAVSIPYYGQLSFASCAKGCASKYAIEAMRNVGVTSAVISLGGNVQTLGLKPDGTEWKVAIQDPNNTSSYIASVSVGEKAVVTSGSYQRFFVASNGKTYHHIIDPRSGYPTTNGVVSVTIVCDDGTLADCLSTAMFVLGKNRSFEYWRKHKNFDMIVVTEDLDMICTNGLIEKIDLKNNNYKLSFVE